MGRSWFLKLLLSMLVVLFFSPGFSRKVMETVEFEQSTAQLEVGSLFSFRVFHYIQFF
ncbi:hypothetical protein PTKIN_Ptkin07bG0053000 [Pterospermum kingtungense]